MFVMLPRQCPFCEHVNPDGAKFCNACGSQLHLKPCHHCDAINGVFVARCRKCGAEFPVQSARSATPVGAAAVLAGASATSSGAGRGPLPDAEPVVPPRTPLSSSNETAQVGEREPPAAVREGDAPDRQSAYALAGSTDPEQAEAWLRAPRPTGASRTSRAVLLGAALAMVALAVYWAYLPEIQSGEWQGTRQADPDGKPVEPAALVASPNEAQTPAAGQDVTLTESLGVDRKTLGIQQATTEETTSPPVPIEATDPLSPPIAAQTESGTTELVGASPNAIEPAHAARTTGKPSGARQSGNRPARTSAAAKTKAKSKTMNRCSQKDRASGLCR